MNYDHGATSFGNTASNVRIFNNHFGSTATWDTGKANYYHHDGIHVFYGGGSTLTGVQIRMRAGTDPLALMDLRDDVRDLLHNRRGYWLRSVRVAVSWRQSEALLGQDAHGRDPDASGVAVSSWRLAMT